MKKLLLLFIPLIGISQQNSSTINHINNRKGKLFFNIGSEYRITPYHKPGPGMYDTSANTNLDLQNSGASIYYSFNFFVSKQLSLNFAHSLRYDLLLYPQGQDFPTIQNSNKAQYVFISDFHTFVDYHIYLNNESQLFIRLGLSAMNRGTDFQKQEIVKDDNNNIIGYITSQLNYNFFANNIGIGFKRNKLDILAGIYQSKNTPYFTEQTKLIIPYLKLGYTIGKL